MGRGDVLVLCYLLEMVLIGWVGCCLMTWQVEFM